jgi:hypothetical protein
MGGKRKWRGRTVRNAAPAQGVRYPSLVAESAVLVPHDDTARWVAAVRDLDDPARRESLIAGGLERARATGWSKAADRLAMVLST